MFEVGELIVFGNNGVCRVEKIGKPELTGVADGVDYYTLSPYYHESSKLFTPCNNDRIVMRPILTKSEAKKLVKEISTIKPLKITDERKREECYKEVMKSCDCRQFVSIIKTINKRKKERLAEGKKSTANDEKYFHLAEEKLFGELAIALEIEKDEVKDFIENQKKAAKTKKATK